MEYNITKTKDQIKAVVELKDKDLQTPFDNALTKLGKGVTVAGFRAGKAPAKLVIKQVGESALQQETISNAIDVAYREVVDKESLQPIDYPAVSLDKFTIDWQDPQQIRGALKASIDIVVLPEVKLGDLSKIKLSKSEEIKVSDEEVEDVVNYLRRQKAKFTPTNKPAQAGDRVEINFSGSLEGVALPELASKNHPIIIGDKTMIPGFEDALIGLKSGDKKSFDLTFPKDYRSEQFAGKKVQFDVELLLVQKMNLPALDEHFLSALGHKDIAKFKTAIRENITQEKEHQEHHVRDEEIINQLLKISSVEVPESLIDKEVELMIEDTKRQIEQYKMNFEDYLKKANKSIEALRQENRVQAKRRVEIGLVLRQLAKHFNLDPSAQDTAHQALHKLEEMAKSEK